MDNPTKFIIEGVDRLGKSTLVEAVQDELGYFTPHHLSKPKILRAYRHDEPIKTKTDELFGSDSQYLYIFQYKQYEEFFKLLKTKGLRLIFDRGHLGEMVYSPLYRGYDGDYVLELERRMKPVDTRLILLTTTDWSFVKDDGDSFDFDKKEEEQAKFIAAFHASTIKDKVLIDVSAGNNKRKSIEKILAEALKK